MSKKLMCCALVTVALVSLVRVTLPAAAQVAGSSSAADATAIDTAQIALGWSVKKTLLGKPLYNDSGQKIGRVDDLIVAPDRNLSYAIIGAGGFLGIGRHDVALPVVLLEEHAGKLVMPGASREMIKAIPEFVYASDAVRRDAFVTAADRDVAQGKSAVAGLEKRAAAAATDDKARIGIELTALRSDLAAAESKLSALKLAGAQRWKEFEADVGAATARLRKSVEKAVG